MSDSVHEAVRDRYSKVVTSESSCCSGETSCGCGSSSAASSTRFGYTAQELSELPDGSDLALGCGNPVALASITPGETVLDLGSGGGIDCFLASARTGETGRVIGVDMTPEMLTRARKNAASGGYANVDFRLGEIEHLPVGDGEVDLIISNCVVNLSPDKAAVFAEAFRVLKPGGRLTISDVVMTEPLPQEARESVGLLTGCIAGALLRDEMLQLLDQAGFSEISVVSETPYAKMEHLEALAAESGISQETTETVVRVARSVVVRAYRPAEG